MTHDELREVVARAIVDSARTMKQDIPAWDDADAWRHPSCGLTIREAALAEADAALAAVWEALRDPDAGMLTVIGPGAFIERPVDLAPIYRAMLAASPLRPAASAEGVG